MWRLITGRKKMIYIVSDHVGALEEVAAQMQALQQRVAAEPGGLAGGKPVRNFSEQSEADFRIGADHGATVRQPRPVHWHSVTRDVVCCIPEEQSALDCCTCAPPAWLQVRHPTPTCSCFKQSIRHPVSILQRTIATALTMVYASAH